MTISSPTWTTSRFETRSSASELPDSPCTTTPAARVRRSTEETALCSSVSRRTRAAPPVTFVTVPTNPSAVTTAALTRTPSSDAGGDDDLLLERRRGPCDHLGRDALVVGREGGRVAVLEQALEDDVLLQRRLVLDHLLLQQLVLGLQILVLGARVEEVLRPAVRVPERARDPLDADLERLQRARDGALGVVQRPVRALAEGRGDQREREQHESPQHDPAPEGTGVA